MSPKKSLQVRVEQRRGRGEGAGSARVGRGGERSVRGSWGGGNQRSVHLRFLAEEILFPDFGGRGEMTALP